MSDFNDMETEVMLSDLERCLGMVSLALLDPFKTVWEDGRQISGITHEKCKPIEPVDESLWEDKDIPPVLYGSIAVCGDQKAEKATDIIRCRCSECGKVFKLNAGYLEALLIIHDQVSYLDEMGPK